MEDVQVAIGCLGGRGGGVVADVETSAIGLWRHGGERESRSGLPW